MKRATFLPDKAISEATADLVLAYGADERVLMGKRSVVLVAIGLLIAAVVAIGEAKAHGT